MSRKTEHAINVADLSILQPPLLWLVQNVLPHNGVRSNARVVEAERGRIDGLAAVLDCDQDRAEAIIYFVRKKYAKNAVRFYTSENGKTWKRV